MILLHNQLSKTQMYDTYMRKAALMFSSEAM